MASPEIIAVWGPPCSGKTTVSVRLGMEIAGSGKSVAIVCCDNITPALPVLFPEALREDLHSIGEIFGSVDITERDILASATVLDKYPDMIYLGYIMGDNAYTWPSFSDRRAGMMLSAIKNSVDKIIVDCCSSISGDPLTEYALKNAGTVIKIHTPEPRSISFYESQLPFFSALGNNDGTKIELLNTTATMFFCRPTNLRIIPTRQ